MSPLTAKPRRDSTAALPTRRATTQLTPGLHDARRRIGADRGRAHAGHLHGVGRGARAAVPARQRQGLGHRRIRHAAARDVHADDARGDGGQSRRPHAGDPAADRPLAALGHDAHRTRRADGLDRLRRDSGRRRHAHGGDHRRLRRARARARTPARARRDSRACPSPTTSRPRASASSAARRCSTSPTTKTPAPTWT